MEQRAVVLAGGWAHPVNEIESSLHLLLSARCPEVAIVVDPADVVPALQQPLDLLVVAACWFSMADERYTPEQRNEFAVVLDEAQQAAIASTLESGVPMLALHTAVLCFDDWAQWPNWLGARWDWATSFHPPPGNIEVQPAAASPMQFGPFVVTDEEYQGLDVAADVTRLAESASGNPLIWSYEPNGSRIAVDLLGHDRRSLDNKDHRLLVHRLIDWLLDDPEGATSHDRDLWTVGAGDRGIFRVG